MARRMALALILTLIGLGPLAISSAAQTATDTAREQGMVARTVNHLFEMAAAGEFDDLYDAMHPDSQAVVERNVALNLFADVYSRVLVDQSQVVGMEFGAWTWEVNGETYQDSVAVDIVQPVLGESNQMEWVADTVFLVKEGGNYLWFIGETSDFVDAVNEQYGGLPAPEGSGEEPQASTDTEPVDIPRDQLIEVVVQDIDEFFRIAVEDAGIDYESPGVVVVPEGESASSACGPATTGFYGFYCPLDSTIYLDEPFLLGLYDQGLGFAAAYVIAHEWAHHVQTGVGFERSTMPDTWNEVHSIELELMADCFAGTWAFDAAQTGLVAPDDIEAAVTTLVFDLGDPKFIGELDPQAHGTGDQRVRAFLNGYEIGWDACNIMIES